MSRPQKKHKPIKGSFNAILGAVAMGEGKGKKTAMMLQEDAVKCSQPKPPAKK